MRKSVLPVIIAAVLLTGLTGCGSDRSTEGSTQKTETVDVSTEANEKETGAAPSGDQAAEADVYAVVDQNAEDAEKKENSSDGILIAYFSRADENYNVGYIEKGNTEILAEMVAEIIGGDLFEIQTINPYPADYDTCTDVAKQEQKDNARPELVGAVENMEQYSVCYLCYPIWWSDLPMAVYSFLDSYDWNGKTIITVNTHEGSGKGGTPDKIQKYLPDANVVDGIAMTGSMAQNSQDEARKQIEEWLAGLTVE